MPRPPPCSEMKRMNSDVLSQPVHCVTVVPCCCCTVSKLYQGCLLCFKSPCGVAAVAASLNLSPCAPCKIDVGSQTGDSADNTLSIRRLLVLI